MHSFYSEDFNAGSASLPEEEAHHAARSLRLKTGDTIALLNGKGDLFRAVIRNILGKKIGIEVVETLAKEPLRPLIHVGISPLKNNDRFEWFMEKAGELGVTSITPLICKRTEHRHFKRERCERILIAALKQSRQAHLPDLKEPVSFREALKSDPSELKLIAHCEDGIKFIPGQLTHASSVSVFIGPEGDFDAGETAMALSAGFKPVSLGETILRTETAAMAICAYLRLQYLK